MPKSNPLSRLSPKVIDNLLRVGGRLGRAPLSLDERHPIILPSSSHITHLLILEAHAKLLHASVAQVIEQLRRRFYIPNLRRTVKSLLNKCIECRRFHARPGEQQMSELPLSRVDTSTSPFYIAGSDLFGPISVKVGRGRARHKRWVVIFACHSTRAIHCEIVYSLTTDSYVNAFRRFISRRGEVHRLVLDQGTNLRGADKVLSDELRTWNESELGRQFHQLGTEFQFFAPKSSHALGATERCIRLVRRHLRHVVMEQDLEDETLHTVIVECEAIVNARPLTAGSQDIDDFRAITPRDLLVLRPDIGLPPGVFPDHSMSTRLLRQWHQVQVLANTFWKRFRREYLPTLHQRQKWLTPRRDFKENDLIIMHDNSLPRNVWKLARVTKTYPSDDGRVRSVQVRTSNGHTFDRPVQKLYLMEGTD